MPFHPFPASSYLALRHVARPGEEWAPGVPAPDPPIWTPGETEVSTPEALIDSLCDLVSLAVGRGPTGVLLGGGAGSALLAALAPPGTRAYTLRFDAPGTVDRSFQARRWARFLRLQHRVVEVGWADVEFELVPLMQRKGAPLLPLEPALARLARVARADGVEQMITAIGAGTLFAPRGPLSRLARDFDAFMHGYIAVPPGAVLRDAVPVRPIFEPHRAGQGIDAAAFLSRVHGAGIIQGFDNALGHAGIDLLAPYGELHPGGPPAAVLFAAAFQELFGTPPPETGRSAGPMSVWMSRWEGPRRADLHPGTEALAGGNARFHVYCLERFRNLLESDRMVQSSGVDAGRGGAHL